MASSSKSFFNQISLENLCRTCLSKETVLYSVFGVYLGTITFDHVIGATTGIKIEQDDGLPANICQRCKEKAIIAFDFKIKSNEANAALQSIYNKGNLEVETYTVKVEHAGADDQDDDLDVDICLPLSPENCKKIDAIKKENEGDNNQTCPQCKICYLVFESSIKLEEHNIQKKCVKVELEDEQGTFCPLCGTCFENADTLTKHMWTNHAELMGPKKRGRPKKLLTSTILSKLSENGYQMKADPIKTKGCLFCKAVFKTKLELGIHMMEHKGTKITCCIICKKMYLNSLNFEQHNCIDGHDNSNKILNEDKTLSIENNDSKRISYITEVLLQELLDPNGDMDNINVLEVCSICSGVFLSEEDLTSHKDAEHPELSQRCNLCSKVFASIKSAARHRNICKQIERKHKCNTCGLKFAYEISLNKHILRFHEGQSVSVKFMDSKTKLHDRQYQCDTCKRCFYRKDLLVRHTKQHMPSEKFFECNVCKKKFNRRDNLISHERVHEIHRNKSAGNNCLCLYCGRSFSNSSNLIVHMRRHTGEKPYKCDFCGKGFPRSSDLQCHRRSHTGEKPCICVVCGKGFSRSNKLSRHMRVHTGHKPYKCTYCDKAFSQSNDLTLHVRRHTGDKPYICEVCGDRFIQGTSLHNHRRAHGHFPASSPDSHPNAQGLSYTSIAPHS